MERNGQTTIEMELEDSTTDRESGYILAPFYHSDLDEGEEDALSSSSNGLDEQRYSSLHNSSLHSSGDVLGTPEQIESHVKNWNAGGSFYIVCFATLSSEFQLRKLMK